MKKTRMLLLFAMTTAMIATVACSKDDDTPNYAPNVAGSYNGTIALSVMGRDQGSSDAQIVIREASDGTVTLCLPTVTGGHAQLPPIDVDKVKVEQDGTGYTLSRATFETVIDDVRYVVTDISGMVEDRTLTLHYDITPEGMNMPISCSFETN